MADNKKENVITFEPSTIETVGKTEMSHAFVGAIRSLESQNRAVQMVLDTSPWTLPREWNALLEVVMHFCRTFPRRGHGPARRDCAP